MKMTTTTATQQKTLFVGAARICQQIAYVLDIRDYAFAKKLTKQNWQQYRDCQIYVCDFKRKSHKLVKLKDKVSNQLSIRYLDDICRAVDEEYAANRKHHTNHASHVKALSTTNKTTTEPVVQRNEYVQQPLWRRIIRGLKNPLRAAWHVVLRVQIAIKHQCALVRQRRARRNYRNKKLNQIKNNMSYLRCLKPSELLVYVLQAKPNQKIQCTFLEKNINIDECGNVKGCCSMVVPFGNLMYDGELNEIYHSTYARIVKLSSLNRSYCLCNLNNWCKGYCADKKPLPSIKWETGLVPTSMTLGFDRLCNLCCKSCRAEPYVMDEKTQEQTSVMVSKLLRSGWLEQIKSLCLAGMGEVFYSPYYRQLWTTDLQRQQITILSNGILFNESNWHLLAGKYTAIDVNISVDAATAETYQKLRGANFNLLMKNLKMLADLHRRKQIRKFGLNFVVQRDNFREIPAFVRLGKSLGVDSIQFQRLHKSKNISADDLVEQGLIIDNCYLDYHLWCVLQDPIFHDPIVNLTRIQRYIDASERYYRQRYEREQKQHRSI